MTPLFYLREEYENVSTALKETLRHDYGPIDGEAYYTECTHRLERVKRRIDRMEEGDTNIPLELAALAAVANRVSLIERSHLGEFSWPFASTIRGIANKLLIERTLKGDTSSPIVHMVAEGTGYHIRNERLTIDALQRIAIVAFPRQLRHHVLMHAIFGHELGHAAFYTNIAGSICKAKVIPELRRSGPLKNEATLIEWLRSPNAPEALRIKIANEGTHQVGNAQVTQWSLELMCDLFGLLLFGPAFVAAHRALLEPASRSSHEIELQNSSHPPLNVRRRMLTMALKVLGWDRPTTTPADAAVHEAELAMLRYILADEGDPWTTLFEQDQLEAALRHLKEVFRDQPSLEAAPPRGEVTTALVRRLARWLPPIFEQIDEIGRAKQISVTASECLYAGWVYWFGREILISNAGALTFLQTNRLCNHALLQQHAIDLCRVHHL